MTVTLLLAGGGIVAGVFGALLGLGGGVLLVPLLTLGFGLPFREAVATSLLAVIATSSASAAVYLERRVADLRLGMLLELGTAAGGLAGGLIAFAVSERLLAAAFAALLGYTSVAMLRRARTERNEQERPSEGVETTTAATASVGDAAGRGYEVRRMPLGLSLSTAAGVVSALLGVGGGTIKVPAMHLVMGVPLRVATATSNLMIGITASAGAVFYLIRGAVDPVVAGPVVVGVFVGAAGASRLAHRVPLPAVRWLFVVVLSWVAVQMAARALGLPLFAAGD